MTKRLLPLALLPALVLLLLALDPPAPRPAAARSSLAPAGYTGAPGEKTCLDCHGTSLNSAGGSVAINVAGLDAGGYNPGQMYDVTVTVSRAFSQCWGFSLTALKNSDNTMAGTLISAQNADSIRTSGGRTYVSHTTLRGVDGTYAGTSGPVSWTLHWVAPAAGAGAVTLYTCGLAADNDGGRSSTDYPFTTTKVIQELIPTAVRETTWGAIKSHYR